MKCPRCKTSLSDDSHFCSKCGTQLIPLKDVSITKTLKTPLPSLGKAIAGKYEILSELGRGGMGIVYRAKDKRLDRFVALKFLPPELTQDKKAKARFIQEAQAAAALNHPNICIIHEVDEANDQTFIAMEFIEGQTLKDRIASGTFGIDEAVKIVAQIGEGLNEAHAKGIVHRDIKPANVMLTDKATAKIMDFGIAKLAAGVDLTKPSTLIGTVAYMSPEQARGEKVDHRTDIWSLGAMFYEMLSGERPFKKDHEQVLLFSILNDEPTPVSVLRSDIPDHIESAIRKTLEKNVSKRFQSIDEFIKKLRSPPPISSSQDRKSIAVLPFTNMSADAEQEYFCDGMAEEIINSLTHIKDLKVIARTSAFAFKGKQQDMREIGRKLGVETLLEGSVRKSGDRLRITAQLINVTDGSHLWSERFDRNMEDVFDIQDEISLAIVDNLKSKLLGSEKKAMLRRYTENSELYNLYLLGRFYTNKRNTESLKKAIDYYKKAMRMDSEYALLYVGLSEAYALSAMGFSANPPKDAFGKAKEAALKAIEINDQLAEAHTVLAYLKEFYEFDLPGAERKFKKAIELNPGYAPAHQYYGEYLMIKRRWDESYSEICRAIELDPLSHVIRTHLGWMYHYQKKIDLAIEQYKNVIEMAPDYAVVYFNLGSAYVIKGLYEEAIEFSKKGVALSGGSPFMKAGLAYAYGQAGKPDLAVEIKDELIELAKSGHINHTSLAWVYIGLNEKDEAINYIEKAIQNKEPIRSFLRAWIEDYLGSDLLSSDPRFDQLLEKYGLE